MHPALVAMGIGPGDVVITSPITLPATANVIEHCGARPVFVDVEPDTLLLDVAALEAFLMAPERRGVDPRLRPSCRCISQDSRVIWIRFWRLLRGTGWR
jgi:hypothetical protein